MKRIIFFCCFPPTKTTKTTTTTKMRRFLITLSLLSLLLPLLSTKPLKPTKPQGGNIASPEYVKSNLGTKRNYEPKGGLDTHTPPPNGCRLFHMEYLARHGTREPTAGKVASFTAIQDSIQNFVQQGGQFNSGYEWMATWQNPYITGEAGLLSAVGQEEHYNTSKRMLQEYAFIMNATYNPNRFHFQETQVSRTGVSASSFAYGVYEEKGTLGPNKYAPPFIYSNSKTNDRELRFFDCCDRYHQEVLDNRTAYDQEEIFAASLEDNSVALSKRLGTYPLWTINYEEFLNMWEICRAEASLSNDYDEFCSIFLEKDVDDLAFREDLDTYWKRGYGHEIDYEIGVDLMNGIFGNIAASLEELKDFVGECRLRGGNDCEDKIKNIPYQLQGAFRFAHAETMIPILTWMGLYYTPPTLMMADTPKEQRDTREWKTTVMAPFSTNMDINVYVCGGGGKREKGREVLVKVLHDEGEVVLPFCGGGVYCSWEEFQANYASLLALNFDTLCDV